MNQRVNGGDCVTDVEIYKYLVAQGLTSQGACGMMGNMFGESGMRSNNIQDSFEKKLGITDKQYVDSVDSGFYKDFAIDGIGMGLCQWTSSNRKQNLLDFAQKRGVSIADPQMQLDFLIQELKTSYKGVYKILTTTTSVQAASDIVLTQFEKPKDQSTAVKSKRLGYSENYYKKFSNITSLKEEKNTLNNMLNINTTYSCNKSNYGSKRASSPSWIVIHYTGNKTDKAVNNAKYFHNNKTRASAHYFVDDNSIYESVSPDYIAWSVGGNKYPNTQGAKYYSICNNSNSISIELCSTNSVITEKTQNNAIQLIKMLMQKYSIPISHVIRHYDVTGKNCPAWTLNTDEAFERFKAKTVNSTIIPSSSTLFKAQVRVQSKLNIRSGPGINYIPIGTLYNNEIVEIVELKNGFGRLKGTQNWICLSYIKKLE